jgi:NAD+ synthase (glutamine-hydrolysing)
MRKLRIGLAQIDVTVGDFKGNVQKIKKYIAEAKSLGVDLVVLPELALCGYPPEDLLLKPAFIEENLRALKEVARVTKEITAVIGFVDADGDIYNAAAIVRDGAVKSVYRKIFLPNYGVFDEDRYFKAGCECPVYIVNGIGVGVNICEDIWYEAGPTTVQAYSGAEVIVNISSSPYHYGKGSFRERMLACRASDNLAIVAYCNLIGGQDELVFDGNSMILNEKGQILARGKQFEEDLVIADLDVESIFRSRLHDPRWRKALMLEDKRWLVSKLVVSEAVSSSDKPTLPERQVEARSYPGEIYDALVLGTGDYIRKNGVQKVVVGLSGGIDSSLVATIAVDALGSENVIGVAMPSRYSSAGSTADAELLASNLDIRLLVIPIEKAFQAYLDMLSPSFKGTEPGVAEENIQARIRGNILMALSNKFGWLVLNTGNKSETATGYTTLYGDMAGGFAVIKDVPKMLVYALAGYRNDVVGSEVIPLAVIEKVPSAELRPAQKDTDSLPPYEVLDVVLKAYVEEDKSVEQIIEMGVDEQVVKRASRLVDASEYKRRQSPPGIKITPRAFGRDRRLPITNRYKGW